MTDFRFAFRQLVRNPGFTALAVLTLALGIGASTVVFTIFNRVFLQPLPFPKPGGLVTFSLENRTKDGTATPSLADLRDLAATAQSFEALTLYRYDYGSFTEGTTPVTVTIGRATPGLFRAFGVAPALGRGFVDDDHNPTQSPVAVLNYDLWQQHFGGTPEVVGRVIQLNQKPHVVIGVMPQDFTDPWDNAKIWVPLQPSPAEAQNRFERWGTPLGRLKEGVTVERAQAELSLLVSGLAQEHPASNADLVGARVGDLRAAVTGYGREVVLVVFGASALILLLACANAVGLMLLRVASRQRELATRAALGASREQTLRLLFAEAALISVLAAGLAGVLTIWGVQAVLTLLPAGYLPRMSEIRADWVTFAFVTGVCSLVCLAVTWLPTVSAWRTEPQWFLAECSRGSQGTHRAGLRRGLVVVQLATAVVLLSAAGLLAAHFIQLLQVNLGVRLDHALTMTLNLPRDLTDTNAKRAAFLDDMLRAVEAVPGVTAAGVSTTHPLGWSIGSDLFIEGQPEELTRNLNVPRDYVSSGFFADSGIVLLAGRVFGEQDGPVSPAGMVLNQALAERLFPGENPVGRRLKLGKETDAFSGEIIGVVSNVRRRGPAEKVEGQLYLSHRQGGFPFLTLIVRTRSADPGSLTQPVQSALRGVNSQLVGNQVATLASAARGQRALPRVQGILVGLFAGLAVLLATVGLYALMAFAVSQRSREFGIRSAVGARTDQLLTLVLREGLYLAAGGLGAGAVAAVVVLRLGRSWLPGVELVNGLVFAGVLVVLFLAVLLACWIPARRAARADPMVALRSE